MNYGGFWIRVLAYIIDFIVLGVVQSAIYLLFGLNLSTAYGLDGDGLGVFETTLGSIAYFATLIAGVLYFSLMESSAKQATVGKMALGLIVTNQNGGRITFLRALGRHFAKFLSGMVLMIGYIMVAFTDRKQGLHDIICSTLVLKAKPGQAGVDTTVFE